MMTRRAYPEPAPLDLKAKLVVLAAWAVVLVMVGAWVWFGWVVLTLVSEWLHP